MSLIGSIIVVLFLTMLVALVPATSSALISVDQAAAEQCGDSRRHVFAVTSGPTPAEVQRAASCGDDCFRYELRCSSGKNFQGGVSRYNPNAVILAYYFAAYSPFFGPAFLTLIAAYFLLIWLGDLKRFPEDQRASTSLDAAVLLVAIALFQGSGIGALYRNPESLTGDNGSAAPLFATWGLLFFCAFKSPSVIAGIPALAEWWHYLFVKHPAEPVVLPALQARSGIDKDAFLESLSLHAKELEKPPPVAASANQAARAQALADKLKANTKLTRAATEWEKARAALLDAERNYKALKDEEKGK
jgi:hypothetical protein